MNKKLSDFEKTLEDNRRYLNKECIRGEKDDTSRHNAIEVKNKLIEAGTIIYAYKLRNME